MLIIIIDFLVISTFIKINHIIKLIFYVTKSLLLLLGKCVTLCDFRNYRLKALKTLRLDVTHTSLSVCDIVWHCVPIVWQLYISFQVRIMRGGWAGLEKSSRSRLRRACSISLETIFKQRCDNLHFLRAEGHSPAHLRVIRGPAADVVAGIVSIPAD